MCAHLGQSPAALRSQSATPSQILPRLGGCLPQTRVYYLFVHQAAEPLYPNHLFLLLDNLITQRAPDSKFNERVYFENTASRAL